jgi:arylformamidase
MTAQRSGRPGGAAAAGWIDVSVPCRDGMVHWPGDPPVRITQVMDLERGDPANLTAIAMSAHTGTHMDAPRHFLAQGAAIDHLPFDAVIGPARVIGIRSLRAITVAELERHAIRRGERLLFRTRNSARVWKTDDFVHLTTDAAAYLGRRRVRTVGVDHLSVSSQDQAAATHRALLAAGVWIIEGLDLARARPGPYDLICLPLRLVGADGAPARAIVRPRRR